MGCRTSLWYAFILVCCITCVDAWHVDDHGIEWVYFPGYVIDGFNTGTTSVANTVDECKERCLNQLNCVSIDYQDNKNCWMNTLNSTTGGGSFVTASDYDYYELKGARGAKLA